MLIAPNARPVLARVLERFPEHAPLIRRRFLVDISFRSACEDYHLAQEALAAHAHHNASAQETRDEYRRLVKELEQEMRAMLASAHGPAA